uniref:Odorant receptor n=1 Tax=Aulacocentrum confusum TaxID=2767324 RepID=A0A7G8Z958_9HYME|nr:olfactory receptor 39 [Aulacocentrum confusum]
MVKSELSEYLLFRTTIKLWLMAVGLWPEDQHYLWLRFLTLFHLFLNSISILAIVGFMVKYKHNIKLLMIGTSIFIGFTGTFFRTAVILVNHKSLKKLHQILDLRFKKILTNSELSEIILNRLKPIRFLSSMLITATYAISFLFSTKPILIMIYMHFFHIYPVRHGFVLPGVYPWKTAVNGLFYKFHLTLEMIAMILSFCATIGVDLLFSLYITQIIGQLIEMSHRISQLNEKKINYQIIKETILQHEVLIECFHDINNIFGPIILWGKIFNAGSICSAMYQINKLPKITPQHLTIPTVFITYKLFQTFICAFAGSQLTEESENYINAVYSTNWQGDKDFMSFIVIMLGKKPFVLTACAFSNISIDMFKDVVSTALSYFFLLQTLDEKN